jgi:hypothetical protein
MHIGCLYFTFIYDMMFATLIQHAKYETWLVFGYVRLYGEG